ncbi:hypothetical protein IW262DRAFT_1498642 [Armillaria fumosa]|nr:hypothetical protein IW262DRAFT_1498642 [Armillaria fumosa]
MSGSGMFGSSSELVGLTPNRMKSNLKDYRTSQCTEHYKEMAWPTDSKMAMQKQLGITGDVNSAKPEAATSDFAQITEHINQLKEVELGVAGQLELHKLHVLRLQYSRAQRNLPVEVNVCSSQPGDPHRMDASRFWAVLIGINEYPSYPLRGCACPVIVFSSLLDPRSTCLLKIQLTPPVPTSSVPFSGLITNPEIAYGDNIIIYYSGHGSYYQYNTGEDDEPECIETLCPIDRDTLGEDGKPVPDISDREFNVILSLISQAKGHHITVILDCCHSGSDVSRCLPDPGVRVSPPTKRATLQDMLVAGENILMRYPGYRSILAEDWLPDMTSHVVLAACEDYQYAKAKKVRREDV